MNADEEHMQRFCKPDGYCLHCGQPANQHHPVGPITITISAPDSDDLSHEFCNWKCLAAWACVQAGVFGPREVDARLKTS